MCLNLQPYVYINAQKAPQDDDPKPLVPPPTLPHVCDTSCNAAQDDDLEPMVPPVMPARGGMMGAYPMARLPAYDDEPMYGGGYSRGMPPRGGYAREWRGGCACEQSVCNSCEYWRTYLPMMTSPCVRGSVPT